MSSRIIRKAFESALAAMPGALPLAKQNAAFKPVLGTPYAETFLLTGHPDGATLGSGFKRDVGVFQVTLCYPDNAGTDAVETKAEEIRARFKRGTVFSADGIRILVDRHPDNGPGQNAPGWYRVPVSVPYAADVFGAV